MSGPIERILPPEDDFDPEEVARVGTEGLLARGIELFDAGDYHQAHEEWEKVWIAGDSGDDDFWKGLIQAAICLHHFRRGELEGARKLYQGHRRYLAAFLPEHRGVDVERLLGEMQQLLRPALRARPGEEVPFDPTAAPRLGKPA
jgi:predicted metal-dependent hydrolase